MHREIVAQSVGREKISEKKRPQDRGVMDTGKMTTTYPASKDHQGSLRSTVPKVAAKE